MRLFNVRKNTLNVRKMRLLNVRKNTLNVRKNTLNVRKMRPLMTSLYIYIQSM